jgi:hypothetical protein
MGTRTMSLLGLKIRQTQTKRTVMIFFLRKKRRQYRVLAPIHLHRS